MSLYIQKGGQNREKQKIFPTKLLITFHIHKMTKSFFFFAAYVKKGGKIKENSKNQKYFLENSLQLFIFVKIPYLK